MSVISVDECFCSPQQPHIKSERLKVKVKSQSASLTVGELKRAIVRKGYPGLSDASRMTLILPIGPGLLLRDDMMASALENDACILALMSSSARDTHLYHVDGQFNLPRILYVYHTNSLKAYARLPHSLLNNDNAGKWISWQTPWSASFVEILTQFQNLGFDPNLVNRELKRLYERRLIDPLSLVSQDCPGYLVPRLFFRLWDATGMNQHDRALRVRHGRTARSEFEVFSACSTYSVDTDTTDATINQDFTAIRPRYASPSSTSTYSFAAPPTVPSVIMASPSEHESAYDDTYHQHFPAPGPAPALTVNDSDCSSDSGRSMVSSNMDWISGYPAHKLETSSRVSRIIKRVTDVTTQRDQVVADRQSIERSGRIDADQIKALLDRQASEFEAERIKLAEELNNLTTVNRALQNEIATEARLASELVATVNQLQDQRQSSERDSTIEALRQIQENLSSVLTCSICCERFGSLSSDVPRRPIHLSCGHIFCATCLHKDWQLRSSQGIEPQARCFNRCSNFDVNRLAEVYLLDDVKEVLDRLPNFEE